LIGDIPNEPGSPHVRREAVLTSSRACFTLPSMPATHLPDDIVTLKRMVASRDETIARLLAEITRLKRWQYGRSSERMAELMGQLQLALGDQRWPRSFRQSRRDLKWSLPDVTLPF
jgi:transposase